MKGNNKMIFVRNPYKKKREENQLDDINNTLSTVVGFKTVH